MWKIVVCDDHPIVLEGVSKVVDEAVGFRVVGRARTTDECLEAVSSAQPDALILDLRVEETLACDTCRSITQISPATKVLVFTAFDDDTELLRACLDAGAASVMIKDAHHLDLVRTLRSVLAGERVVDPRVAARVDEESKTNEIGRYERLTPREHEVIRQLALGRTSREIASELHLALNTVRSYNQSILTKLRARNRVEALATARQLRLI